MAESLIRAYIYYLIHISVFLLETNIFLENGILFSKFIFFWKHVPKIDFVSEITGIPHSNEGKDFKFKIYYTLIFIFYYNM